MVVAHVVSNMAQDTRDWYVNGDGSFDPVSEVWESMGGDLWLITEPNGKAGFGYARLAAMPQFAEWGTIHRQKLVESEGIWQVDRENWPNVNTYEDGLLEQES